jgi:hypothetical protein
MSEYDRHEAAMYDALREDEEERQARKARKPWKECWGVWYPAVETVTPFEPERVCLYATEEQAQYKQIRNGSRIVRVQLFREEV